MYKFSIIFLLSLLITNAKEIKPIAIIEVSGLVSDFVEDKGYLYVATDAGSVDIIDLSQQKIVKQILFQPLLTAMGDHIATRIHSVDRYQGKTLLVTSGISAYRNVWIEDEEGLKKIIDEKAHIMPKYAYFNKSGQIVFGTFGSDIILYDHQENYKLYHSHISESTMGGMVLSEDKEKMIIADESGTVRIIDLNSSKVEQVLDSEHVDNIYRVAHSKGITVTAGQDRRVGVYLKDKNAYHIKSDFLVYCVGLSPSGKIGLYSSGLNHDLQIFHIQTGKKTDRLVGHYATPNKIMFINENALISAGDENRIFFWMLKNN